MNLIVTDGKTEVTRFKEIIEDDNIKRIVVNIAGGTDSPLVVYFLAKFITQTEKYDKEIFPHFMVDTGNMLSIATTLIPKQLDLIRGLFPDVTIHDVYTQDFRREEVWNDTLQRYGPGEYTYSILSLKSRYCEPLKEKMLKVLRPDVVLNGKTTNLPPSIQKLYGLSVDRQPQKRAVGEPERWPQEMKDKTPWHMVDKKFIAYQYRKENLMDNLFPLTESCLAESSGKLVDYGLTPDSYPCKVCYQCIEKYLAFGMYDKCETKRIHTHNIRTSKGFK